MVMVVMMVKLCFQRGLESSSDDAADDAIVGDALLLPLLLLLRRRRLRVPAAVRCPREDGDGPPRPRRAAPLVRVREHEGRERGKRSKFSLDRLLVFARYFFFFFSFQILDAFSLYSLYSTQFARFKGKSRDRAGQNRVDPTRN